MTVFRQESCRTRVNLVKSRPTMDLDDALRRYRADRFTDDDVVRCTGLSKRAYRELIKVGAIRTVTERRGPGRVRLCDASTFKRVAVIAAINCVGLSLPMAGRIAYFLPFEELLFAVWDPITTLLMHGAEVDLETGLPPRWKTPKADWFDPDKPAQADPANDWLLEIYEARFVGAVYNIPGEPGGDPFIYADLRDEGTTFVTWLPFHQQRPVFDTKQKEFVNSFAAKWEQPHAFSDRLGRQFLNYRYENHETEGDPLRRSAEAIARSPLFKSTINVTLAIRKALRRYLASSRRPPPMKWRAPMTLRSRKSTESIANRSIDRRLRERRGDPPVPSRFSSL